MGGLRRPHVPEVRTLVNLDTNSSCAVRFVRADPGRQSQRPRGEVEYCLSIPSRGLAVRHPHAIVGRFRTGGRAGDSDGPKGPIFTRPICTSQRTETPQRHPKFSAELIPFLRLIPGLIKPPMLVTVRQFAHFCAPCAAIFLRANQHLTFVSDERRSPGPGQSAVNPPPLMPGTPVGGR